MQLNLVTRPLGAFASALRRESFAALGRWRAGGYVEGQGDLVSRLIKELLELLYDLYGLLT